eukprot:Skav204895  [mRNA]  locus=scaffold1926:136339:144650:+ [translate_table: standard]
MGISPAQRREDIAMTGTMGDIEMTETARCRLLLLSAAATVDETIRETAAAGAETSGHRAAGLRRPRLRPGRMAAAGIRDRRGAEEEEAVVDPGIGGILEGIDQEEDLGHDGWTRRAAEEAEIIVEATAGRMGTQLGATAAWNLVVATSDGEPGSDASRSWWSQPQPRWPRRPRRPRWPGPGAAGRRAGRRWPPPALRAVPRRPAMGSGANGHGDDGNDYGSLFKMAMD